MIAATGAKNGAGWPHTWTDTHQAIDAATDACTIVRHAIRRRVQRVDIDTRERSVASSISGWSTARAGIRRVGGPAAAPRTAARPALTLRARRRRARARGPPACT